MIIMKMQKSSKTSGYDNNEDAEEFINFW